MTKEIAKIENYDLAQAGQMVDMSKLLKLHIIEQKLFTPIAGKNYVQVEGWQFAGGLMGLYPRIISVENLSNQEEIKWKADVEVVRLVDDKVVGRGFAVCSNKESKKRSFDEYAILSMAQTRAIGKAYRNLVGWVMKLAGYQSTPAEEMEEKKVEVEVDNNKAFADIIAKIQKYDKNTQSEMAKRMLLTPPFELSDDQAQALEALCL